MNCERCNAACELVQGTVPWDVEHWICPNCDSTYCVEGGEI
jgi:hypothetical protein